MRSTFDEVNRAGLPTQYRPARIVAELLHRFLREVRPVWFYSAHPGNELIPTGHLLNDEFIVQLVVIGYEQRGKKSRHLINLMLVEVCRHQVPMHYFIDLCGIPQNEMLFHRSLGRTVVIRLTVSFFL